MSLNHAWLLVELSSILFQNIIINLIYILVWQD